MAFFKRSLLLTALLVAFLALQGAVDTPLLRAEAGGHQQFLPQISRDSCPPFLEDFSTTANGWFEGGIFVQEYGYTNEEYFLRLLAPGFVASVPMPYDCNAEEVEAQVTGRWLEEPGLGFGIQFGPALTGTLYYIFEANPESGTYRVLQRTGAGTTVFISDTPTPALEAGQPATLRMSLIHDVVVLYVNGVPLEEFDYLDEGPIRLGLSIATSNAQATLPVEARFDDVRVYVP